MAALSGSVLAGDYHVAAIDAPSLAAAATGSADRPWPTVAAALDSRRLAPGDRLLLAPGFHGTLSIRKHSFEPPLRIESAAPDRAQAAAIDIRGSRGLDIHGLDVWPQAVGEQGALVSVDAGSSHVRLSGLDIRSRADALDWLDWSKDEWLERRRLGVRLQGSDSVLADSTITGVAGGVNISGARNTVRGNTISGFSRDGMRANGDHARVIGNTIRDCVKVDKNHDDGIQSWAPPDKPGVPVTGVLLEANRIIEWTGAEDHPLRCGLQGIGLFDGPYEGWVIRNNLILVRTHHGLSLYGMRAGVVVHNTVINVSGAPGKRQPWIKLDEASQAGGNTVVGNLATAMRLGDMPWQQHNIVVRYPAAVFEDPLGFDYRLRTDSPLRGTADPGLAPPTDIDGTPRPQGNGPDPGAYERP